MLTDGLKINDGTFSGGDINSNLKNPDENFCRLTPGFDVGFANTQRI